jgi:hypothetical protein
MLNFDEEMWSPLGPRPHTIIPVSAEVAEMAEAIVDHIKKWWSEQGDSRDFHQVFRPIQPRYLHLTLSWLDRLSTSLDRSQLIALADAIEKRTSVLPPCEIQVGPLQVGTYAIELYVNPHPTLELIDSEIRSAFQEVFGVDSVPEPPVDRPFRPHIAAFYCQRQVNTDTLNSRLWYVSGLSDNGLLKPTRMPVNQVLLCDMDTWSETGLQWSNENSFPLSF